MVTPGELLAAALRYAEMGYPVFPCVPGGKMPLTERGFLDATADPEQIERWWTQHPSANIGIPTAGLVVIDIDGASNPWPADPERALDLAAAPMALTPRGGSHRFFRQPTGKNWRCTAGRLAAKVDTRADGGYVVVPPSVFEGKAYRWASGLELDEPPDRLPEPPAWLVADLDRLANGSPTAAHVAADPPEANAIPEGQRNATLARLAGTMRRVGMSQPEIAAALARVNADRCIPTPTSTNGAAGAPEANVIPEGQRNATLAKLGGNMRRVGMSQPEIAAALARVNADRCVPPLAPREVERIAASIARYEPDQVSVALVENHWDQMYAEPAEEGEAVTNPDPGPIPDHLLRVPGFIDAVMTHTLDTAPYPEPLLAFCGALSLQALLASRSVRDAMDNRTNLYVLSLANSGAGKDHPRKINARILYEVGLANCIGDAFASGEGIEDRLFIQPATLFQTDEIDGLLLKVAQARDSRHEAIVSILLKMYSSASSIYVMRARAAQERTAIDQPCLCLFGTAVPRHFYEALSSRMLTNGLLARLLVLEAGKRGRGQNAIARSLPPTVLEAARWWAEFRPGTGNLANWHPVPKVIEHTPEADDVFRDMRERADAEYARAETVNDLTGMAIWARAHEKARRLALIYACSADHLAPRIDASAARWAGAFAEHQTRRMLFMAGAHVSENEFDAKCKKLLATLRKWRDRHGDAWMPFWQVSRAHPWSEREHEEIRATLLNQRVAEYQEKKTTGRPQRLYRVIASAVVNS